MNRRRFILQSSKAGVALSLGATLMACIDQNTDTVVQPKKSKVIALCTWGFSEANAAAGKALESGSTALEAAITGVAVEEANIKNSTVGKGGAPDREGNVTLDACVMDANGDCGAVVCVQNITHVAALAKVVMKETEHVMLAGEGAEELAYRHGFQKENLLTEKAAEDYRAWLKTSKYEPIINIENHDTIGMLCMDQHGDIAGACTTSGLSYKMKGRVGDSPIIGAGLFIDNEVGGAAATGMGEEIMKQVGSFLIVELMRQGKSPQEACEVAMQRIVSKNKDINKFQVAYIAINKAGATGSYCIHPGFSRMEYRNGKNTRIPSAAHFTN
ncbi:isoaspartyl peptidase/L-asparaginase family protein [Nonlabens xiamenensis]|uniref:isoaspartyl peptidase/L-asparaginase family protein n=1 Tax=Nonlabens xiamenensis TaxID=2341043 RepID=UPI000F606810|nr:N(4)-(beta-N-acetylglucosaminyl)-L-asparaginase [Nonlabens xiamenensis]